MIIEYTIEDYHTDELHVKKVDVEEVDETTDEQTIFQNLFRSIWVNRLRVLKSFTLPHLNKTYHIDGNDTQLHNLIYDKEYTYRNWQNLESDAIAAKYDFIKARDALEYYAKIERIETQSEF